MSDANAIIVGTSAWAKAIRSRVVQAAPAADCVLVTGPSGSGKSWLAQALHQAGPRRDQPFFPVDCSLLPGTLFDGEVFGHGAGGLVRGVGAAAGALRAAGGGTVLLQHVDQIAPFGQQCLLAALRDRQVLPLGTSVRVPFSARIVATANVDLTQEVACGRFHVELLAELSATTLEMVDLSSRINDLSELAAHLLIEMCGDAAGEYEFSPAAMDLLHSYDWPGNVRELRNFLSNVVSMRAGHTGQVRFGSSAVRRLLFPLRTPWDATQRCVERTRFPGLGVQRLDEQPTCSSRIAATPLPRRGLIAPELSAGRFYRSHRQFCRPLAAAVFFCLPGPHLCAGLEP